MQMLSFAVHLAFSHKHAEDIVYTIFDCQQLFLRDGKQDPYAVGVAFRAGGGGKAGRQEDLKDYSDDPTPRVRTRKRKSSGSKSKGFAKSRT